MNSRRWKRRLAFFVVFAWGWMAGLFVWKFAGYWGLLLTLMVGAGIWAISYLLDENG